MYARLENENIITYRRLPIQFEDENGLHLNFRNVADPTAFGFYNVVNPSYDSISQRLGAIEWDEDNDVFTYPVIDIDFDATYEVMAADEEPTGETLPVYDINKLKSDKKKEVNEQAGSLLISTDWYVIRKSERDIEIPIDIASERADIVTKANGFVDAIDALKTVESVLRYTFAYYPSEDLV